MRIVTNSCFHPSSSSPSSSHLGGRREGKGGNTSHPPMLPPHSPIRPTLPSTDFIFVFWTVDASGSDPFRPFRADASDVLTRPLSSFLFHPPCFIRNASSATGRKIRNRWKSSRFIPHSGGFLDSTVNWLSCWCWRGCAPPDPDSGRWILDGAAAGFEFPIRSEFDSAGIPAPAG